MAKVRIGGLQRSSMIDYPGRICCVLFVSGCNFSCPYCHNPELARGQCVEEMSVRRFFEFIGNRRNFLDAVVISGGEPTLSDDLVDVCRRIRRLGLMVKLDTNGSRPGMLRRLLDAGCLDYVAMDVKTDFKHYGLLCSENSVTDRIKKSIAIVLSAGISHEFRTTCVKPLLDAEVVERILQYISGAQRYFLQRFVPSELLDPTFCRDKACLFSEEELLELKAAAAVYVNHCSLR